MSPTSSPARSTRMRPESVTAPIAAPFTSHFAHSAITAATSAGLDHAQHPLLGLADHHLERLHVGLAQRHLGDVDVDPDAALRCHLRGGGGEAGGAEVLQRRRAGPARAARASTPAASSPRTGRRPGPSGACRVLLAVAPSSAEASTEAPPMPSRPVEAPNRTSNVAGPGGGAAHEPLARREAERHRVDEAVVLVGRLEVHLAADRRHADRVAVVADARDGAVEQIARARAAPMLAAGLAEAQRVEHGDRAGADGEDVTQDAARRRWRRPGRARRRWGGCATRP